MDLDALSERENDDRISYLTREPRLVALYERHRKCLIKHHDGRIEDLASARRMTLGFHKLAALVAAARVGQDDVVLSCFGGPGGTVKFLSLLSPRLLIATDLHYSGPTYTDLDWVFASDEGFEAWATALNGLDCAVPWRVRRPLFLQMDIRQPFRAFDGAIDRMIIDPPYGQISFDLLGLDASTSRVLFSASLAAASRFLRSEGTASALVPRPWVDDVLGNPQLELTARRVIGTADRFEVVSFVRRPGD